MVRITIGRFGVFYYYTIMMSGVDLLRGGNAEEQRNTAKILMTNFIGFFSHFDVLFFILCLFTTIAKGSRHD